ncbi:MAG: GNAT family N-acetyltransferase [Phyllobacteriaceae bacterium]|nr:GNAT family N-acetyltransferase [Nitratireductor sp.]MCO5135638.1 GNAT family N-acetyltransferase [Phyllobacteriaceae bacterium]
MQQQLTRQTDGRNNRPDDSLYIHRLTPGDLDRVRDHFLRLSPKSRRLRFGRPVSDEFLERYAEALFEAVSIVYGAEIDGVIRGVTEMRGDTTSWSRFAEAAVSVEDDYQDRGIGGALLKRLVQAAQNRGVSQLYMVCLRENHKMKHLAQKNEAILDYCVDEVEGRITDLHPSFASLFSEWFDEASDYVTSLMTPARK